MQQLLELSSLGWSGSEELSDLRDLLDKLLTRSYLSEMQSIEISLMW